MQENIILVNEQDQEVATMEKLLAHQEGHLHRAFSIYIFQDPQTVMLQQRALGKYHCPGLWTNTTCSHPRPGETVESAAHRRLQEEMGFNAPLKHVTEFIYRVPFENGLEEHEYLHVFIGRQSGDPVPNPEEAAGWKWADLSWLQSDMANRPDQYTYWLKITLPKIIPFIPSLFE